MATISKAKRTTKVTTLMGYEATIADASNTYEGSFVWENLKAKKTVEIRNEQNTVLIPFHAVKKIETSIATAEVEKADAYC